MEKPERHCLKGSECISWVTGQIKNGCAKRTASLLWCSCQRCTTWLWSWGNIRQTQTEMRATKYLACSLQKCEHPERRGRPGTASDWRRLKRLENWMRCGMGAGFFFFFFFCYKGHCWNQYNGAWRLEGCNAWILISWILIFLLEYPCLQDIHAAVLEVLATTAGGDSLLKGVGGFPRWHSRWRIWHCFCSDTDLISDLGTFTCLGTAKKKAV